MRDKAILLSLAVVGLLAAFYFMVLSPKREKASELGEKVTQLESSIDAQKQLVASSEQTRQEFPTYYGRLVVLGKAVPEQADTASMIVQLNQIANRTKVEFRGLTLGEGGGDAPAAPAPAPAAPPSGTGETPAPPSDGGAPAPPSGDGATPASTTAPAPATEATAANLPIGATVGPAGLPILPYDLTFTGSFFDATSFLAGVDSLVQLREGSGQVAANGRLLTVDGFSLSSPTLDPVPSLKMDFSVTSYVVPSDQGLTAGAAPSGPATSPAQPPTTPTSAPVTP
jgi:Tfp pilus assembly protein PilO